VAKWIVVALLLLAAASSVFAAAIRRGGAREAVPTVANHAFASAPKPRAPAEIWAVGDGAAGTPVARRLADRIARARPDRVLYLGDVYETGSASEFRRHFATVYRPLLGRMAPTPGNHEWPDHRTGYDPFWRSVTGVPTPPWYAFDIGGWHLLSLNSETPSNGGQLRWLQRRIRANGTGTCALAFWHRPRFSAGTHGDQRDVGPLWDALHRHAALVLSGHDHDLQRLRPIGGLTQIVAGAGGRGHYPVDRSDRRLAFADDTHYAALRLRLSPRRARLAFIAVDGTVLDRSAVRCR
jgi:hypothetical protein